MEEEEEKEEPWEGKKRSRVALRSSALASNHRGGKRAGCTKNVGTLTVRTVHGTGGTCWAGLGFSGSGSSRWHCRFDRAKVREKDLVTLYGEHSWRAGRTTNTGLKLTATVGCCWQDVRCT